MFGGGDGCSEVSLLIGSRVLRILLLVSSLLGLARGSTGDGTLRKVIVFDSLGLFTLLSSALLCRLEVIFADSSNATNSCLTEVVFGTLLLTTLGPLLGAS